MERPDRHRRLIVNADDFGRSSSINEAVERAHREGILTTASLMVNGSAVEEAVRIARANPGLGVGLHLTLLCGTCALPPSQIPDLVDVSGNFPDDPVKTGMRYFFCSRLKSQLTEEIQAQLEKFEATGLELDHVNGHLHLHLHPVVFKILMSMVTRFRIRRMRLTRDNLLINARLALGQWPYRLSHATIYRLLGNWARPELVRRGIAHTERVFGLLQNARVDEPFVRGLLNSLPSGDSELYSHPSLDQFKNEFDALISPGVKELVTRQGITLIRYQDL
jgi:hopanoid biosynthesis associated protein HpnK